MADPGFPVGGGGGGGADLRRVHFSAKTNAKTKEMDPVGMGGGGAPADLPVDIICILDRLHLSLAVTESYSNIG